MESESVGMAGALPIRHGVNAVQQFNAGVYAITSQYVDQQFHYGLAGWAFFGALVESSLYKMAADAIHSSHLARYRFSGRDSVAPAPSLFTFTWDILKHFRARVHEVDVIPKIDLKSA